MKQLLRSGLGLLGVGALVALSVAAYPRLFGRKRLRFTYLTGQIAPAEYERLATQPGWRKQAVAVAPGVHLNGLVRPPTAAQAQWVLYFPGNDATQLARGQKFLSSVAGGEDWGLAVFAYRGYDSSEGVPTLEALAADAPILIEQLCSTEGTTTDRVNVVGFSIGTHLAVRATATLTQRAHAPRSLSLLAPVDDIVMLRRSPWQRLATGDDYQTQQYLAPLRAPVLIVQGAEDETLAGPGQGQAVARALGERAEYAELAGVGHNALLETPAAIERLHRFIRAQATR